MSAIAADSKRRWTVSALGALVVVVVALMLVRVPDAPLPTRAPPKPVVQVAPRATVHEQTMMLDLAPLFLPTKYNATFREKDLPLHEPGESFLDRAALPPAQGDTDRNLTENLPPVATLRGQPLAKARPLDALSLEGTGALALGFGRDNAPVQPLASRGGCVQVTMLTSGERMLTENLSIEARPPVDKAWQPVEFFAAIDAAGLVGPLTLGPPGSGVDEVDSYLRNFLAQTWRVGERLPPGFYRISVTP